MQTLVEIFSFLCLAACAVFAISALVSLFVN